MRVFKILLPAVVIGALFVIAGCSDGAGEGNGWKGSAERFSEGGRGRGVVETPLEGNILQPAPVSLTRLEGMLVFEDPEWYLDTGDDNVALLLGNRSYLESLDTELKEGGKAEVFGIMEDDGLSVVRISTEDGEILLRNESGVPLWAGNGNRSGNGQHQRTGQYHGSNGRKYR